MDQIESNVEKPISDDDLFSLAYSHGRAGKWEEAILFYDLYLLINPWSSEAINNKADALRALGRVEEARELVFWALTLNPLMNEAWCTLGELQAMDRESFCARLNYELSLELKGPDHPLYEETLQFLKALDD